MATTSLVCAAHSPLLYCYERAPDGWAELQTAFSERSEAIRAFAPELVIAFTSDHYNGFFLDLMPAFCVGLKAESVNDIGGFPGPLNVPTDEAEALTIYLRGSGFDMAVSQKMKVDHALSQTLKIMLGELDAAPVIPVFINCINKPFVPFKRSRLLGEAIGNYVRALDKRVLLLGSGGLSHNPTRYYPAFGDGDEKVTAYQLTGGKEAPSLTHEEWLQRLNDMHIEGAKMLVNGSRTKADLKLNPEVDEHFLDLAVSGNLIEVDSWVPEILVQKAGIGWMEMHTWIAAIAANAAGGGPEPTVDFYGEMLEIGIAAGVMHA